MRKIILYSAMSLNGHIARADGRVDWLDAIPNPEQSDYGYYDFYAGIDTTLQGNATYRQVKGWDIEFPYKDKKNYVLTRQQDLPPDENVEYITHNHIETIRQMKQMEGQDIWLIGGGQINTLLFNASLIDELILHIMPIVLPDGIALFEAIPAEKQLQLLRSKSYSSGVLELHYQIK
ncbi:MAG: dihydrofolate reductase family protein [Bacteroidota bacterium]